MLDFQKFKLPIAKQFERISKHPLFRVDIDNNLLWETYLAAFPEGTNPIYRERREYDCSCCKQFVRSIGGAVAIIDGEVVSVWDAPIEEPAFQAVASALSSLVKSKSIDNALLHYERTVGTDKNFEQLTEGVATWSHFFVNLPEKYVAVKAKIGPKLSETRAQHDVLYRSLSELTDEALDTVLELIAQNSLYRGEEHKFALETFQKTKREFSRIESESARHAFVWSKIGELPGSVAKIRNTSIGTLLIDLSEGMELDAAVRRFESVVAPANYKRPTALVTPKMIAAAKQTLADLGLISALQRRYARLEDLSINDILYADRSAKRVLTPDVFDTLTTKATTPKNLEKPEEVAIEKFISDVLPKAETLEVFFDNKHAGNMVSLIAPDDPTANQLFKWDNKFSWSYQGDFADSIKERVKKAGGNVTGDLCCRLSWDNQDDLDLHMLEPGGAHICFSNRTSRSGGHLDVDANGMDGLRDNPAENIYYPDRSRMLEGEYRLTVHQYNKRNSTDGFQAEIDFMGSIHRFSYEKVMRTGATIEIARFKYSKANGIEILESLPSTQSSRDIWGLKSQQFHRVNVVTLSPNQWGKPVGNKHYLFMLADCRNDGQARGFFNEFLKEELTPHRKVIEMVGSKLKTAEDLHQLSGLGFSSTQRNELLVRVSGSFNRTVKVIF